MNNNCLILMSVELKKSYSRIINQIKCLSTRRNPIPANGFFNNSLIKSSIDSFRKKVLMKKDKQSYTTKRDLSRNGNATERIKDTISSLTSQFNRNVPLCPTARNDYYKIRNTTFEGSAQFNMKIKFNQMRHLLNQSSNGNIFVNVNNRVNAVKAHVNHQLKNYRRLSENQSIESFANEFRAGFDESNKTKKDIGSYPTLVAMGITLNRLRPSNSCGDLGVRTRINLLNY